MVLRILILLFIPLVAIAQNRDINKVHYRRMIELYEQGKMDEALNILKTNIDLNRSDVSNDIMFLAAAIYHKSGNTSKALSTLNFLIKKRYMNEHRTAMRSYSSQGNASDLGDLPKGLILLYLQKGLIYVDILKVQYANMNQRQRQTLSKMVQMAADTALEVGFKEDFADALLATLRQIEKDFTDAQINNNWFTGIHYVTWRDEITLISAGGQEVPIRTTNSGLMFILGKRWANAFYEWSYSGGYALADATVGNDDPNVNYFQSGVASSLLAASADWHWRPSAGQIAIGAEGMIAYRTGDYEDPPGSGGIDDKSKITLGALASFKWRIEPIEFQTKFGKLLGMPSSFVSFGLLYHF